MDVTIFGVDGMRCEGCAERIRRLLRKEPGVERAATRRAGEGVP